MKGTACPQMSYSTLPYTGPTEIILISFERQSLCGMHFERLNIAVSFGYG